MYILSKKFWLQIWFHKLKPGKECENERRMHREWNKADELYEYVIQESLLAWVYNTGSVGGDDMKKFNPRRD